ncbi:MAG: primosomal protein N' [Bacilli bacterium]
MFAEVLVEYNAKSIDKTFTYKIPDYIKDNLKIGMKVLVPFGNKLINGFVTKIKNSYEESYSLKEIDSIVDLNLVLNEELLSIGKYLQKTTLSTLIAAYQTMLPSSLKVKEQKHKYDKYLTYIKLIKEEQEVIKYINNHPNRKKQIEVLEVLLIDHKVLKSEISSNIVKALLEEELITEEKEQIYRLDYGNVYDEDLTKLTEEQQNVVNAIDLDKYNTYLVHGVTGSGKTEVYIKLIKNVVANGKTAILLVPEITLTTQIVSRFYERFGNDVAIFHSALSDGEKYDEYLKILRKEVHIVVGTRSAIFTPLTNLGIIIIDEEHSETYKQENMPRYNAIDIAKYRANYNNIPLILGSATPSLETMARSLKGVYKYLEMPHRIGTSILPNIEIVDISREMKKGNMVISDLLKQKITDRLNKKEQIILLLNRRGFSTIITCSSCGYTYKCPHCDISLTYHKSSNNLRCHYCGYTVFKENKCPECHEESLNYYGLGTEKLELELSKQFPNAKIVRMDTDTTIRKGSHQKIIDQFKNHEYDILVGTQMISKGLDFPLVTLVGVINADTTLNIPDFRSGERTFSLLSQVSGRAGRSTIPGEVILQTFNPDNFILNCVKENNYMKFYNYEMENRHKLNYPPYYYLCSIRVTSKDYDIASQEITKVRNFLNKNLSPNSIILGPTTAAMFRINNIYRFQILIKYKKDDKLNDTLRELDRLFVLNNKANIEIDTSPIRV